ncbi:RimK family alpha-L-glutamate ligase [Thermodesulfobacteriota bacterium]
MLGIYREDVYSPNRIDDDAAILQLTAEAISRRGYSVQLVKPSEIASEPSTSVVFGMCEGPGALRTLEKWESEGHTLINSPQAVQNCYRNKMLSLLAKKPIPFPKTLIQQTSERVNGQFDLKNGLWVKRGDVHNTHPGDVRLIYDRASLDEAIQALYTRWIKQVVLQEHIEGDLIKFYGVLTEGWFQYFYHKPDEKHGYPFEPEAIRATAELAAKNLDLKIFGGDIVIAEDGHYLVDINSWPSFAICREEAAEQIASCLIRCYEEMEPYSDQQGKLV